MIVPYAAGGATDVVIRIVANKLSELLKQQVVIDNRAGAGGLLVRGRGGVLVADLPGIGHPAPAPARPSR